MDFAQSDVPLGPCGCGPRLQECEQELGGLKGELCERVRELEGLQGELERVKGDQVLIRSDELGESRKKLLSAQQERAQLNQEVRVASFPPATSWEFHLFLPHPRKKP